MVILGCSLISVASLMVILLVASWYKNHKKGLSAFMLMSFLPLSLVAVSVSLLIWS